MNAKEMYQLQDKPPITVAPLAVRAHEGASWLTRWCPTCRERTVPCKGRCLFVDGKVR